jgi:hypothetical protein
MVPLAWLFGKSYSRAQILERCGNVDQFGGIRLAELTDGPARGVRTAEIRTGSGLEVQATLDRCLDLTHGSFKGIPLCWRSSVGDIHPSFYEPGGLGWLRTFAGGILATCGLTQAGAPNRDGEEELGLHGRIGTCPASRVSVTEGWAGDEYVMSISGEAKEASVFGPHLVLCRKLTAKLGGNSILIEDRIENRGPKVSPLMVIYHMNIGWPIVSEHSLLVAPSRDVLPRDADAAAHLDRHTGFEAPADEFPEQVFLHDLKTDAEGRTLVGLLNHELGVGVTLRYRKADLPYFNQWKMNEKGHYVCGIEPANCRTTGRADARAQDELELIGPGESRLSTIEFAVVEGEELDAITSEVAGM